MKILTTLKASGIVLAAAAAMLVGKTETAQAQASEPTLGQAMLVGFNFCPRGWARADGQLLPISQYSALFSLFGTIYGGDGRTTFALPDMRGRAPVHTGTRPGGPTYVQGQRGGNETTTLTENNLPPHDHDFTVNGTFEFADKRGPGGKVLGRLPSGAQGIYQDPPADPANLRPMVSGTTSNTGSGVAAATQSPYITMNWCIALEGTFPSRS